MGHTKKFFVDGPTVVACEEELFKRKEERTRIQPSILVSGSILDPK